MIWAVLLLPLAGFLLLAASGSRLEKALGRRALGVISVLPIFVAFGIGAAITNQLSNLGSSQAVQIVSGPDWISILGLKIPFELTVDPLSMTMTLIITGVGALIFLYSTGYMGDEREYSRFFTYLNLFVASMLLLVLANNLALLFVGWEGVGLCSYLLIGFWYKDLTNAKAANKAFIVNRIGDWGLLLGIFLILCVAANAGVIKDGRLLSFDALGPVLERQFANHSDLATAAALLIFVGAAGKSAQFPLYLWLPDAMAGPTPVSALIHAATMVTSGVVLLNRMHVVFELSPVASAVVCGIGAFTACYAALIAFGQTDIKKVLAYSTVSQLGFMFIGCGAGAYWAGMFHVTTHAFFKALLFLGAGAVIHAMSHEQDMRKYGNLRKYLPITTWTMFIGVWAIVAIPPAAGFFSKEALLAPTFTFEGLMMGNSTVQAMAGWLGLFTAMLTAAYMTRLWGLTFTGKERWKTAEVDHHDHEAIHHHEPLPEPEADFMEDPDDFYLETPYVVEEAHAHGLSADHLPKEVPPSMWIPLVVLAALSLGGGWYLAQGDRFKNWLAPISAAKLPSAPETEGALLNLGGISISLMEVSLAAAILGIVLGVIIIRSEKFEDSGWSKSRLWLRRQFGFDDAMTEAAIEGGNQLGLGLANGIEAGLIDRIVNGLYTLVTEASNGFKLINRGIVRSYALMMLIGGLLIVGYMTLNFSNPSTSATPSEAPNQTTTTQQP